MDEEWEYNTNQELSQWADVSSPRALPVGSDSLRVLPMARSPGSFSMGKIVPVQGRCGSPVGRWHTSRAVPLGIKCNSPGSVSMAPLLPRRVPQWLSQQLLLPQAGPAEEEEPPEPLAPEVEKAPDSPPLSEEVLSAMTESPVPASHSPPGCSQTLLDLVWNINMSKAVLEIQASVQMPPASGTEGPGAEHGYTTKSSSSSMKGRDPDLYPTQPLLHPQPTSKPPRSTHPQ